MDSTLRVYAVQAWKNLLFSADRRSLKVVLPEISESSLSVLICGNILIFVMPNDKFLIWKILDLINFICIIISDSEAYVQEQALGLVCNIISGCNDAIDKILSTGISDTISRQLCQTSSTEVCIQVIIYDLITLIWFQILQYNYGIFFVQFSVLVIVFSVLYSFHL